MIEINGDTRWMDDRYLYTPNRLKEKQTDEIITSYTETGNRIRMTIINYCGVCFFLFALFFKINLYQPLGWLMQMFITQLSLSSLYKNWMATNLSNVSKEKNKIQAKIITKVKKEWLSYRTETKKNPEEEQLGVFVEKLSVELAYDCTKWWTLMWQREKAESLRRGNPSARRLTETVPLVFSEC